MERIKVIIDTDPGVDDNNTLVYALNDNRFDIKLITTSNGNVGLDRSTKAVLHLLDVFNKDIPVARGYEQRMGNNNEDALFLHGREGLGNYIPPAETEHKALNVDCCDIMYETIKKYPKDITLVVLGPHTNVAYLFKKYPDAKDYIKDIVMASGAPGGLKNNPNYISFNIRTDAPSFRYTINSGLPVTMSPSTIGRDVTHFTEEEVDRIKNSGVVGRYLAKTFETYWEPGYPDRRISACDISAMYTLIYPEFYTMETCDIELDTEEYVGKLTTVDNVNGQFKVVVDVDATRFHDELLRLLDEFNNLDIANEYFLNQNA